MASAIIVAAGSGKRMNSSRPKQYLDLAGAPVLSRTLMAFDEHPEVENIFLVVAPGEIEYCRSNILSPVSWETPVQLVPGGEKRQDSVYEGLKAAARVMDMHDIILIHDGVRPFVSSGLITSCIACAKRVGACVPGEPASDTLKRVDAGGGVSETVSRENLWLVQTPQAFGLKLITEAFESALKSGVSVTDDAAVVERYGKPVQIIRGRRENIKITTPEDLEFALSLLRLTGKS